MKNFKVVLLIFLVLIVIVGGVFLYKRSTTPPLTVNAILPQQPVLFFHVKNIEQNLNEMSQTKFWKIMSGIDYIRIMREGGMDEKLIERYAQMKSQVFSEEFKLFMNMFFGREIACAVYSPEGSLVDSENMLNVVSKMYIVTRLKPKVKFAEKFSGLLEKVDPNIVVEEVEHEKHKFYMISTKGMPFKICYTRIQDFLIIGLSEEVARKTIEIYKEKIPALKEDSLYQQVNSGATPQADLLAYMNYARLVGDLKKQIMGWLGAPEDVHDVLRQQIDETFKQSSGFQTVSFSALLNPELKLKLNVYYNPAELAPEIKPLYECQAQDNGTLQFVPQEVLGYQWSPCYDLDAYWRQSQDDLQRALLSKGVDVVSSEEVVAGLEQNLGLSIEQDILPALGREFGWYWKDVKVGSVIPVPQVVVFLKTRNQSKVDQILRDLIGKQPLLRADTEEYEGENIRYFNVPMIEGLEPAYSFIDGYLLIASSRESIKEAFETRSGKNPSIISQADFRKEDYGLTQKNNAIIFLNFTGIAKKASDLLAWSQGWVDQQMAKHQAFRDGTERRMKDVIDNIIADKDLIATLESEIESLKDQKDSIKEQPEELAKVENEIGRIEKFMNVLEKSLEPDLKEEAELKSVQNDENFKLPPAGVARLKFLKDSIEKKQMKLQSLKDEMKMYADQRHELTSIDEKKAQVEKTIAEKAREIEELKVRIESSVDTQSELEEVIKELDSRRTLTPEQRTDIVEMFVKPVIEAVSQLTSFAAKALLGSGMIEIEAFMRIK